MSPRVSPPGPSFGELGSETSVEVEIDLPQLAQSTRSVRLPSVRSALPLAATRGDDRRANMCLDESCVADDGEVIGPGPGHGRSPFGVRAEHTWVGRGPYTTRAAGLATNSKVSISRAIDPRNRALTASRYALQRDESRSPSRESRTDDRRSHAAPSIRRAPTESAFPSFRRRLSSSTRPSCRSPRRPKRAPKRPCRERRSPT